MVGCGTFLRVTTSLISQLTLIALAAVVAPVLAELSGPLAIPGVVIEIVLGILIGPKVLGWTSPTGLVLDFSNFGLALLMFLAGAELDLPLLRGRPIKRASLSWACSLVLAAVVGLVILVTGHKHGEIVTGLALSTTALGTLLPILRDGGILDSPLGRYVLAVGSVGEFGPIVLVALVLSGQNPGVDRAAAPGVRGVGGDLGVRCEPPLGASHYRLGSRGSAFEFSAAHPVVLAAHCDDGLSGEPPRTGCAPGLLRGGDDRSRSGRRERRG